MRGVQAIVILAAAGLVGLLAYGIAAQGQDRTIDDRLSRQQVAPAPAFDLGVLTRGEIPPRLRPVVDRAAADGSISLAELRGTPVVVNLWASWCDPCREEAGRLEAAWRRDGPRGVLVLGVNQQDSSDSAREFIDEFEVGYLNVKEAGRDVGDDFGATGLPETFFISARGDVVGHVTGAVSSEDLRRGVAAAEAGKPIRGPF